MVLDGMTEHAGFPNHPLVVTLLKNVKRDGDDKVVIAADVISSCKSQLLTELRDEPMVFLQILIMWSDFVDMQCEPAAGQLLELLSLWPEIQQESSRAELLAKAERAKAQLMSNTNDRMSATLASNGGLGGFGLRKPNKPN